MKDNAWFVGFAPRQNPEIVVVALFEGGEHGQFAAPIVRDVMKAYFDKKTRIAEQKPEIADIGAPLLLVSPEQSREPRGSAIDPHALLPFHPRFRLGDVHCGARHLRPGRPADLQRDARYRLAGRMVETSHLHLSGAAA